MTDPADHSTDDETGRREASQERPWYDVRTYDAGNGDAAVARGGIVLLSPGEYRLNGLVTLRSGVRVRGMEIDATTVFVTGEGFAAFEGFGSTEQPLTDLAIDCSGLGGRAY